MLTFNVDVIQLVPTGQLQLYNVIQQMLNDDTFCIWTGFEMTMARKGLIYTKKTNFIS